MTPEERHGPAGLSGTLATAEVVVTRNEDGTLTPEVTREGNRVVPVPLELLLQMIDDLNAYMAEVARLREGIERHRQQVGHLGCDANPALWALLEARDLLIGGAS